MKIVQTKDTMSEIYLDALRIRNHVFVEEQQVPLALEIDEKEAYSIHFVLYVDGKAQATVRLLPLDETHVKVQRMAVEKAARGKKYGQQLLQAAEDFAQRQGFTQITLGAQLTAQAFYEKNGYVAQGPIFLDAGIEHVEMTKELKPIKANTKPL
ncbi:GNAT family N-acetyltransferase [Enterococcus asini]|uniref:GNAT family N-acetyltransferase n=1 Tax=Enterococcus asini TaxID=57732 RepID=UPI00288ECBE5|nr:GNAT family N-acetyltransferase [Enterococcus asini]MDT2756806.1 GNAT family N-acetyltransferase [Enterococcus asini]